MAWFLRPDAFSAFDNEEIRDTIPRYIRVVRREEPPLFRLAQGIFLDVNDDPWAAHDEGLRILSKCVVEGECAREKRDGRISLLELKALLARDLLRNCSLCEWKCGVNRLEGQVGVCRVRDPRVASAFIHMGEEAPITPSGTIFFSGCNFRCVFCQNWDISQFPESGRRVDERELASLMDELRRQGARNINLVGGEPTPDLPLIISSLNLVKEDFPVVWNSNMYMSKEAMKLLLGLVDLWLPDFKYWSDECARRYSGVLNYRGVVTRNLKMAYEYPPGEIVLRHLVLPNHLDCCTKPILRWISENIPDILVNIMDQYRPEYRASKFDEINRRVTTEEMMEAYQLADELGLKWRSVSR